MGSAFLRKYYTNTFAVKASRLLFQNFILHYVKESVELYLHSPSTLLWRDTQLKKHKDNFTFTFTSYLMFEIMHLFKCKRIQNVWKIECPVFVKFYSNYILSSGFQVLFLWGYTGRGVKLTTQLHLVLRSKNEWIYTPNTPSWRGAQLKKSTGVTLPFTIHETVH